MSLTLRVYSFDIVHVFNVRFNFHLNNRKMTKKKSFINFVMPLAFYTAQGMKSEIFLKITQRILIERVKSNC